MEFLSLTSSLGRFWPDSPLCQEANEKFLPSLLMLLQFEGKTLGMKKYTRAARECVVGGEGWGRDRETSHSFVCTPRLAAEAPLEGT